MKVLLFDIETTPFHIVAWGVREQNAAAVLRNRELLCAAYQWLGDSKIHFIRRKNLAQDADKDMAQKLGALFDEADFLVAHNGSGFDKPVVYSRFVKHKITPPAPAKMIDTCLQARQFGFPSNRLKDLAEYLGIGTKRETGGIGLWMDCLAGKKDAWRKMEDYNRHDVRLLAQVRERLQPYLESHPNIVGERRVCPRCGGTLNSRGWTYNTTMKYRLLRCKQCKANVREKKGQSFTEVK